MLPCKTHLRSFPELEIIVFIDASTDTYYIPFEVVNNRNILDLVRHNSIYYNGKRGQTILEEQWGVCPPQHIGMWEGTGHSMQFLRYIYGPQAAKYFRASPEEQLIFSTSGKVQWKHAFYRPKYISIYRNPCLKLSQLLAPRTK